MIAGLSLAVVGVQYPNAKRGAPTRRFAIDLCRPGDPVHLVPEPWNPKDAYAVMVLNKDGMRMGYVTAERAPLVSRWIADGRDIAAIFQKPAAYGAVIRVALDGAVPELPREPDMAVAAPAEATDSGFYPDEIWPDE